MLLDSRTAADQTTAIFLTPGARAMIGLLLRLLFHSMQDQYEPEAGPRRPRRRDDVRHAPVFSVLRESKRLEQEGDLDEAIAVLEEFLHETPNAMFKEMCRQRIEAIS